MHRLLSCAAISMDDNHTHYDKQYNFDWHHYYSSCPRTFPLYLDAFFISNTNISVSTPIKSLYPPENEKDGMATIDSDEEENRPLSVCKVTVNSVESESKCLGVFQFGDH